ncbi:type I restriction enzyme M protein [Algoriphagus ornithinivorans]|uniref:site-specific DNA-methyltransferase (adenine-specific) n=1 Tax=Algoriphagus ornithinivorans TaxID=226506 RepID=A0A1I5GXW8_9BACT|nr:type I restriction-modification system subunit M [Algoriphagus ornithinivorans]SFO40884.1 type I restriction enzyme M protein [Algoriphagus ornithinivorans]
MSLINSNPQIAAKIDDLWNKFWSGGISNPLTAIEQITYLLFMKKMDENDLEALANAEFTGEPYVSKFEGTFYLTKEDEEKQQNGIEKQTLRWSQFKRLPSDEMLAHIQRAVFPFLKKLDKEDSLFAQHMVNAVFIIPKPSLLKEAISSIDEIYEEMEKDSNEKGQDFQDIQGDVYEMLLSEIASAGKNGQFRTPRHIIKLLVDLVDPKLGQKVADPACGTGGFLLGAYQYMVTQLDKEKDKRTPDEDGFIRNSKSALLTEDVKEILGKSLYGYDIDSTMVRLGLMNLMMHGIDNPQIDYKDTLSKSYHETSEYDIVLANPPFTGNIDKGDIHEELQLKTTKTELLFIERIFNMLKMGGTAGIVVPQGVLFGTSGAFVEARKLMIEQAELKAVVTCPSGVFKPYAGVSTALLVFTKGGETENVWFYDMESDGYTLDDKRAKIGGYGDLQDIITQFKNRDPRQEDAREGKHFFVPKEEIVEADYDLSYSKYRNEVFDEIEYENPHEILEKLIGENGLENQIISSLEELKKVIQ